MTGNEGDNLDSIADMLGIYRKMSTVLKCERLRGDIY